MAKNLWLHHTRTTTTDKCIVFDFDQLQARTFDDEHTEITFESAFNDPNTIHFRNHLYMIDYPEFDTETRNKSWGILRPGFFEFLEFCFQHFKIVAVWSAGIHDYVHSVIESVWYSKYSPHVTFTRRECVDICVECKGVNIHSFYSSEIDNYVWICKDCQQQCEYCENMTEKELMKEAALHDDDENKCQCKYNVVPCVKPLEKFWKHPIWGKYMSEKNTIIIDDKRSVYKYCNPDNGIQVPEFEPPISLNLFSKLFECCCDYCCSVRSNSSRSDISCNSCNTPCDAVSTGKTSSCNTTKGNTSCNTTKGNSIKGKCESSDECTASDYEASEGCEERNESECEKSEMSGSEYEDSDECGDGGENECGEKACGEKECGKKACGEKECEKEENLCDVEKGEDSGKIMKCEKKWHDNSFKKLMLFFQSKEFIECEDIRKINKEIFTKEELKHNRE